MKSFVRSKVGIISVTAFVLMMAVVFYRVVDRRSDRKATAAAPSMAPVAVAAPTAVPQTVPPAPSASSPPARAARAAAPDLTENAAYLDQWFSLRAKTRQDRDRQGVPLTRRQTANSAGGGAQTISPDDEVTPVQPARGSLRLQGRSGGVSPRSSSLAAQTVEPAATTQAVAGQSRSLVAPVAPARPKRFNPYGNVLRCELVFTLDSTNEETPLVGVVMEPVYNNGQLIIPAGAELHGVARPDRLRDRIFSGEDWVLVFPRESGKPNGRQLNVRGVALERIEPDASGITWGVTDGSYGLEGKLIRTMQQEEIKRFAATFFAEAAQTLQSRDTGHRGQESLNNTPQNAVLQGLSANLQKIADDIAAEVERHGVFIRVPAGHQFYFYPTQIIDPDVADISADVATVK